MLPVIDATLMSDRPLWPFDSTKGGRRMGIGACRVIEVVRAAHGEVRVRSDPGLGMRNEIELPASGGGRV